MTIILFLVSGWRSYLIFVIVQYLSVRHIKFTTTLQKRRRNEVDERGEKNDMAKQKQIDNRRNGTCVY